MQHHSKQTKSQLLVFCIGIQISIKVGPKLFKRIALLIVMNFE